MLPTSTVVDLLDLVTAASGTEAEQRVFGWSVEDRVRVAFLGRFDFLFGLFGLLSISAFAVACALGSRVFRSGLLVELGLLLVWLALLAYLLDFTENLASRQSTPGAAPLDSSRKRPTSGPHGPGSILDPAPVGPTRKPESPIERSRQRRTWGRHGFTPDQIQRAIQ
jgi:hypothetical protein